MDRKTLQLAADILAKYDIFPQQMYTKSYISKKIKQIARRGISIPRKKSWPLGIIEKGLPVQVNERTRRITYVYDTLQHFEIPYVELKHFIALQIKEGQL